VKKAELTQQRLKELLDYDQDTGEFRWRVQKRTSVPAGEIAGCRAHSTYWCIGIDGRTYRANQLAWLYVKGEWGRPLVDHRDGNPLNNRFSNLRLSSHSNNVANQSRKQSNTSGFKGVHRDRRRGKWIAQIKKDGRQYRLGRFATPEDAHAAYVAKARELFGEFARTE
jgi:hypothetical protein